MTKRKDDRPYGTEPKQFTRRETLKVGGGLLAVGYGIGVTLVSTEASAAARHLELRFLKADGTPIDSLVLPTAVAEAIDAGDAEGIEFVWHVKKGDTKRKVAEQAAPGRAQVAQRKARKPGN
ncbi:MAG: hypothetical protein ABI634_08215 [Acidobacteriota bacterium]